MEVQRRVVGEQRADDDLLYSGLRVVLLVESVVERAWKQSYLAIVFELLTHGLATLQGIPKMLKTIRS